MTETTAYWRPDLAIDQTLALKTAATRLAAEFDRTYGAETIERFLHSSYDQLATIGAIPNFLPLLAEPFARQRLPAWPGWKVINVTVSRWCCSCAPTLPVAASVDFSTTCTSPPEPRPACPEHLESLHS